MSASGSRRDLSFEALRCFLAGEARMAIAGHEQSWGLSCPLPRATVRRGGPSLAPTCRKSSIIASDCRAPNSAELVQAVLDEICDAAARGETVKLSSFGSFVVRSKGQRIGRNPKTGVEVPILPRRVMVFKPSNVLKSRINAAPNGRDENAG